MIHARVFQGRFTSAYDEVSAAVILADQPACKQSKRGFHGILTSKKKKKTLLHMRSSENEELWKRTCSRYTHSRHINLYAIRRAADDVARMYTRACRHALRCIDIAPIFFVQRDRGGAEREREREREKDTSTNKKTDRLYGA
jgi:hypothetical protein